MYHRVGSPLARSIVRGQYVLPALFRAQLTDLLAQGYRPLPARDLLASPAQATGHFSVTFDDGYASIATHAAPILAELGVPATVFVVVGSIGQTNTWDQRLGDCVERLLNLDELRTLAAAGFEIASHSLSHAHLTQLTAPALREEIAGARHRLEDQLGHPVTGFAYPYGEWDARARAMVIEAGYSYAMSTQKGTLGGSLDRFTLPRLNMRWNTVGPLLTWKIRLATRADGVRKTGS